MHFRSFASCVFIFNRLRFAVLETTHMLAVRGAHGVALMVVLDAGGSGAMVRDRPGGFQVYVLWSLFARKQNTTVC